MQRLKAENLGNRYPTCHSISVRRVAYFKSWRRIVPRLFVLNFFIYSLRSINLSQTTLPYRTYVFIVTPAAKYPDTRRFIVVHLTRSKFLFTPPIDESRPQTQCCEAIKNTKFFFFYSEKDLRGLAGRFVKHLRHVI